MATTKKEEQVKAAMAKVEAAKAAEKKAEPAAEKKAPARAAAKKAPAKATEKKAPAKAAEKKAPAKAAEKKAPAKTAAKKTPAKAAEKKAPAKKTAAAKTVETVYVQCFGYEITTDDIKAKVNEAVGKKSVKELNIYVKPEEGTIYFTADGEQGSVAL